MQNHVNIYALPPNNTDAEKSVLGSMIQDPTSVNIATEVLSDEDFYLAEHKTIFSAMQSLNRISEPIDLMTLSNELNRLGKLEGVGGTSYLLNLIEFVPSTVNIKSYLQIVLEKSTLRKLIYACKDISKSCYTQEDSLNEILYGAEKQIYDIVMRQSGSNTIKPISEVLKTTFNYIEELSNLQGKLSGVPTGFYDLDRMLTGLHSGELIIVGARPSMGKTSIALSMAQYASVNANRKTAFFSLEMPSKQIGLRLMCSAASINMQKINNGSLSDDEWIKLADCLNDLSNSPMFIDDFSQITPSQLRSRCRKLKMEYGLDLIVIDYLQFMQPDKKVDNRQVEVSEISRQLKGIAMELQVPVIACAQLSRRAAKTNESHRPMLSDLRESGSIEQDADVVIFVHRDNYYKSKNEENNESDEEINDNEGVLIVAKQRNGPTGDVKVEWQPDFARYTNMYGTKVAEFIRS